MMIFSAVDPKSYVKPRCGIQYNWSLSTLGSLLILLLELSLKIKGHVIVSLKILY